MSGHPRVIARHLPAGFGGTRRSPEDVKRDGWVDQGILAVAVDDPRLTWPERELIRQLGQKLYGPGPEKEPRHD